MNTEPNKSGRKPVLSRLFSNLPRLVPSFILKNWPWKLLALFLAVCLWAGLITQDPTLTRERVFNDVTVSVNSADLLRRNSGLVVISGLEEENLKARLRADVPQRNYNTVTASNFNPRVELTRITGVGEQELRVLYTSSTTYGSVQDVTPSTIKVVVDEYVTNYRVPVSVNITGDYPEGFYGSSISVDPSVVAVSGPKTLVDQVARVTVDFDVSRLSAHEGEVRMARVMQFMDREGNPVESDMLEASSAGVVLRTIILEQTLYPLREFTVDTASMVEGTPAKGYCVKNITVSPSTVMAAGTSDALDSIEKLFAASALNLNNLSSSFTETVRVRKPFELTYLSPDVVTVTVEIEPTPISRTFENAKLSARGTGNGLKAVLEKKSVSMVLTGPQLVLENLRNSEVTSYVDVSGLEAGIHELPVQLHIEGIDMSGIEWVATPASVTVTLTEQ